MDNTVPAHKTYLTRHDVEVRKLYEQLSKRNQYLYEQLEKNTEQLGFLNTRREQLKTELDNNIERIYQNKILPPSQEDLLNDRIELEKLMTELNGRI